MTGRRISHFEVLEKLGEGGMGVVYKARDLDLGRMVALKMLPANLGNDPGRRARFLQEAQAASALNHPNIVTVYEIFREDGNEFIAMEYLDGKTLGDSIGPKGLKLEEALRVGEQIAAALGAAHGAGIVHRDLKPANVIVSGLGVAKVLDFGLAKLTETGPEDATLTEAGAVMGTIAYMSPEQAEGKAVDWRSDIFSFGTLLYEMVTGRRAFGAEGRLLTLSSVLEQEPAAMGEAVPRELQRLVARCMKKKAGERAQSMVDVKHALEEIRGEIASGQMSGAFAAAPGKKGSRWPVVAAGGIWMLVGRKAEAVVYKPVPFTSYPGQERHPALSPDGNFVAFVWNGTEEDNFAIYVRRVGSGEPLRLTRSAESDSQPAWSPNGDYLAFYRNGAAGTAGLYVVPALGGAERRLSGAGRSGDGLAWTGDGKAIVVSEMHWLALVPVDTGEPVRLTLPMERKSHFHITHPVSSPSGKELAFVIEDAVEGDSIYVVDWVAPGKMAAPVREVVKGRGNGLRQVAWSGDGSSLFFVDGLGGMSRIFRVAAAGGVPEMLTGFGENSESLTVSRNRMVYGTSQQDTDLWKMEIGPEGKAGPETVFLQSTRVERAPAFSPDGKELVFYSDRTGERELWLVNRDGSNARQLTRSAPVGLLTSWKPDGSEILFRASPEKGRAVYRIRRDGATARQVGPPGGLGVRWSADGRVIYYSFAPLEAGDRYYIYGMEAVGDGPGVVMEKSELGGGDAEMFAVTQDGKYQWLVDYSGVVGGPEFRGILRKRLSDGELTALPNGQTTVDYSFAADGVFVVEGNPPVLRFCSYEGTQLVDVARLPAGAILRRRGQAGGRQFTVSPDRKTIVYGKQGPAVRDLYLVEGLQ